MRRVSQLREKISVVFGLIGLAVLFVGCATSEPSNSDPAAISAAGAPSSGGAVPTASGDQRLEALWKQRTEETTGSDFHVGPGDVLGVSVPAIEQLKDLKVRVSASDTIDLPMIGLIDVHGMTEHQVRDEISRRLEKYMYHPVVSVFGVEYQSREVAVVGAVQKPGVYTLASRSQTILQMVSEAGMTSNAAQKLILIPHGLDREGEATRMLALAQAKDTGSVKPVAVAQVDKDQSAQPQGSQGSEPVQDLKSNPSSGSYGSLLKKDAYVEIDLGGSSGQSHVDLPARPGDVIIIPESGSVMIQGWVANAGAYKISPGMTVLSAVAAAGGEMFSSSAEVLRTDHNGEKVTIPVDLAKAKKGDEPDPAVQSGDVVIVNRSAALERRRRPHPRIFAVEPGGGGADVPRRGSFAHSRRRDPRRADPRQARAGRLARACRPEPVAVRQRRDLGPRADRPARDDDQRTGPVSGAHSPHRAQRRADHPRRRRRRHAAHGRAVRHRPHDRGGDRKRREREARGFTFSYDMLGEAATTAQDAARYLDEYERAVHAIGRASHRRGIYEGPGISIKLSALHPALSAHQARPRDERIAAAREGARRRSPKSHDIGFNIDAEEADRLDLSLDILEALSLDPDLRGWNGLGFVIQAYGKRCSAVVDWLIDLGRRSRRRLMIRLVKGAYWDSEIKRAQLDGLDGFPVFTRKVYTDVSYLACARKLLAAPDAVYPQFATHNAQTLASVLVFAGPDFYRGQYEFQCLHGMGEPLYEEVVGRHKLDRPCRVYAPVGSHETLLAYLVRRLLENGANTSFVNRIADASVALDDLIADPVAVARRVQPPGAPHDRIAAPRDLYAPDRVNSRGLDFSDEGRLDRLAKGLQASADTSWRAFPPGAAGDDPGEAVLNPANLSDVVGFARHARADEIEEAIAVGDRAASAFAAIAPNERAASFVAPPTSSKRATISSSASSCAKRASPTPMRSRKCARRPTSCATMRTRRRARCCPAPLRPLGLVVCISPWNFPLAIFTGQVAAALAAGNSVIAKPAEETPLIAAEAVRALHEAGVPARGASSSCRARAKSARRWSPIPAFKGSSSPARRRSRALIEKELAGRLTRRGAPLPLIAETGGLNAMVVDFLGARRAGGRRRHVVGVRFGRPALFGFCAFSACRRTSPTACSRC